LTPSTKFFTSTIQTIHNHLSPLLIHIVLYSTIKKAPLAASTVQAMSFRNRLSESKGGRLPGTI